MLFSQYSWGDFFKVVGGLAAPYYGIVAWKFYREDIRDWFTRQRSGETTKPPVQTDAETEDEDGDGDNALFVVKDYQPAPELPKKRTKKAKAKTDQEAGKPPRPKRKKPDPDKATDAAPKGDSSTENKAPNEEPKNEATAHDSQAGGDASFLPEVPVATEAALPQDFLFELGGVAESQSELVLDVIIEAAQNLEKGEDGAVLTTESAGDQELRLARLINQQNADQDGLDPDLMGIKFSR